MEAWLCERASHASCYCCSLSLSFQKIPRGFKPLKGLLCLRAYEVENPNQTSLHRKPIRRCVTQLGKGGTEAY